MNSEQIEHTVLGTSVSDRDISIAGEDAEVFGTRLCVPPDRVQDVAGRFDVEVTTVVNFPLGHQSLKPVEAQAVQAQNWGADEIDVVAPSRWFYGVQQREKVRFLERIRDAVDVPLKLIVEPQEYEVEGALRQTARLAKTCQWDYLKTCTGFHDNGATEEYVNMLSDYLPVKASGGIRSLSEAEDMVEAGAERIGTSDGTQIAAGLQR